MPTPQTHMAQGGGLMEGMRMPQLLPRMLVGDFNLEASLDGGHTLREPWQLVGGNKPSAASGPSVLGPSAAA